MSKSFIPAYLKLLKSGELSLRVEQGEIYVFLGLNGAGKATTIRMVLGMVKPTSGEVRVLRPQSGRRYRYWDG